jgi:organic radical activating enzyme
MKLSAALKELGDDVEWWNPLKEYDTVYSSKVFDFTPINAYLPEDAIKGGTGYGGDAVMADWVEHVMPDYSLYGIKGTAYGFLTRGCPRNCPFCIVTAKEGNESRHVADLSSFWRGSKYIKLLDPNLLAFRYREYLLQQLAESGAWVDFTQGLDIRLITEDNARLINRIRIQRIHFAWDNPKQDLTEHFKRFKALSQITDRRKLGVYVLTNYDSAHEEDLQRIYTLRDLGYDPYVMIYDKPNAPRRTKQLQRWVNNRIIFRSVPRFEDYDPKRG